MIDKSLQARLRRLFSTQVIVRRTGKGKIKVIDTSRNQQITTRSINPHLDRFKRLHVADGSRNRYTGSDIKTAKLDFYADYEAMDQDPIITSALDIYADESTVKNTEGEIVAIQTEDENLRKVIHNLLYDILNIEHNIWSWTRNLCKYGDFYLYLDLENKIGVKNVIPVSPYILKREEGYDPNNPHAYRFVDEGMSHSSYVNTLSRNKTGVYEAHEIAHFRLLSDQNFLPYGKAMIENARKIYKQLTLMEDAMMLTRIMRAPERRIFKINVGNIPPEEVDAFIEEVKSKMQKTPYITSTGEYNLKYNLMNMLEDYFIPVRGDLSTTEIDTLPGMDSQSQLDDVDYLRKKQMSSLKIPAAFLGYDEGVEGKSTLAAEDIRFARTIERIQNVMASELTKIVIIHLYIQGYRDKDLAAFKLEFNSPSIVYERQKVDLLNEQIDLAINLIDSRLFSKQWVYQNIFGFSTDQIKELEKEVLEDAKERFRLEQIEAEGNDPKESGESFGTPHDLAALQMQASLAGSEEKPDGARADTDGEETRGAPTKKGSFGTHDDVNGVDPDGRKQVAKAMTVSKKDDPLQTKYKGKGPLDTESVQKMLKGLDKISAKKKRVIQETYNTEVTSLLEGISFMEEDNIKTL